MHYVDIEMGILKEDVFFTTHRRLSHLVRTKTYIDAQYDELTGTPKEHFLENLSNFIRKGFEIHQFFPLSKVRRLEQVISDAFKAGEMQGFSELDFHRDNLRYFFCYHLLLTTVVFRGTLSLEGESMRELYGEKCHLYNSGIQPV